jgi:hypothetical protein
MKYNILVIFVFIYVIACISSEAQTLCQQKIDIQNQKKEGSNSSFELKLKSTDTFSGQLIEIGENGQSVVQTFSGQGDTQQSFKNLKNSYYRVILEFQNEEKFLCKRKIFTVDLTDSQ